MGTINRFLLLVAVAAAVLPQWASAQSLSVAQMTTLKACINANSTWAEMPNDSESAVLIANGMNQISAPPFKVWRTSVSRVEIYNNTSDEATTWSWTFYKNQSAVEQNAWVQMFMGDQADFSKANLRSGISVIFTSASAANATHALAIGKRSATVGEKCLSTGTGSVSIPATMGYEGNIQWPDVQAARGM